MNEKNIMVTVCVPVYNGEHYITAALNSVLNQEYKHYKVIILDNASTDSTETICKDFVENDSRFYYFKNEKNIGASNNFQNAVNMVETKYFVWLAHDDYWETTFLSECINRLENAPENTLLCTVDTNPIDEYNNSIYEIKDHPVYNGFENIGMSVSDSALAFIKLGPCACLYGVIKTDLFKKFNEIPEVFAADYILLLSMLLSHIFLRVPKKLLNYRIENAKLIDNKFYTNRFYTGKKPTPTTDLTKNVLKTILKSTISTRNKFIIILKYFIYIFNYSWLASLANENLPNWLLKFIRKYFLKIIKIMMRAKY